MNGLQALDGSDTPRTATVRRLARRPAALAATRTRFLRRPLAIMHYSRDSLRLASAFSADAQGAERTLSGWHALLELAGYRVDFVDDAGLALLRADAAALLVLPFTTVTSDAQVAHLAGYAGPLVAGPHTAMCDDHGRLRNRRLPARLARVWGLEFGLWCDVGRIPRAGKLPTPGGWRELQPTSPAAVVARLGNGKPLAVRYAAAVVTAVDLGQLMLIADRAQQKQLTRLLFRKPRLA